MPMLGFTRRRSGLSAATDCHSQKENGLVAGSSTSLKEADSQGHRRRETQPSMALPAPRRCAESDRLGRIDGNAYLLPSFSRKSSERSDSTIMLGQSSGRETLSPKSPARRTARKAEALTDSPRQELHYRSKCFANSISTSLESSLKAIECPQEFGERPSLGQTQSCSKLELQRESGSDLRQHVKNNWVRTPSRVGRSSSSSAIPTDSLKMNTAANQQFTEAALAKKNNVFAKSQADRNSAKHMRGYLAGIHSEVQISKIPLRRMASDASSISSKSEVSAGASTSFIPALRPLPTKRIASRVVSSAGAAEEDTWRSTIDDKTYTELLREHGTRGIKRQELIWELCSTESSFVTGIRMIHRQFCRKVRQDFTQGPNKAPPKVARLFDSFGKILVLHTAFDWCLQNIRESQTPFVEYLAHALLPLIEKIEHPYSLYLSDLTEACRLIEQCISRQDEFGRFLKQQSALPDMGNLPLTSHLLKPAQRLMKYPLFFKNIVDLMPEDDEDYDAMLELHAKIDAAIRKTQEKKCQYEWDEELRMYADRIKGMPNDLELVDGKSHLVKQAAMSLLTLPDHLDIVQALSLQEVRSDGSASTLSGTQSWTGSSLNSTGSSDFFQKRHTRDHTGSLSSLQSCTSKSTEEDWNEIVDLADQYEAARKAEVGGGSTEKTMLEGRIGIQDVHVFLLSNLMLITRKDMSRLKSSASNETSYRLIKPPLAIHHVQAVGNAKGLVVILARQYRSDLSQVSTMGVEELSIVLALPESTKLLWLKELERVREFTQARVEAADRERFSLKSAQSRSSLHGSIDDASFKTTHQDRDPVIKDLQKGNQQSRKDLFAELKAKRQKELLESQVEPDLSAQDTASIKSRKSGSAIMTPRSNDIKTIFFASLGLGGFSNTRRDSASSGRRTSSSSFTVTAR